jgi:hypothetical protein
MKTQFVTAMVCKFRQLSAHTTIGQRELDIPTEIIKSQLLFAKQERRCCELKVEVLEDTTYARDLLT